MDMKKIEKLAEMIKDARSLVFFGGAGVSTESGIPDFRSKNGIYSKNIGAEHILTPGFMHHDSEEYWRFYRAYLMPKGVEPNDCHKVLARMEEKGLCDAVITQNVDALHQKAGSRNVIELHGNGQRFFCEKCRKAYSFEEVDAMDLVPRCTACGALIRPDIVHYEEALDQDNILRAVSAIQGADLLIIGGTSLVVYPAAGLITYQKSEGRKVLINQSETYSDSLADLIIRDPIGQVFKALAPLINL
ncbi:MAG: NAD-dependent protein deacylase [Clostridiales bacterium]|nr:NAD-dependent protein deacylase [Clostridiales bacterium]MDD7432303.1 NAD-dependent protein deacylase [Clostridiales bacterium]MDY3062277.1 NAD-dependent protein deacylase [Eubacteriales bacterium]